MMNLHIIFLIIYLIVCVSTWILLKNKISRKILYVIIAGISLFFLLAHRYAMMEVEFDAFLKKNKIFVAIKAKDPKKFKEFSDNLFKEILRDSHFSKEAQLQIAVFVNQMFSKYLKTASDQDIYAYLEAYIKMIEYYSKIEPNFALTTDADIADKMELINEIPKLQAYDKANKNYFVNHIANLMDEAKANIILNASDLNNQPSYDKNKMSLLIKPIFLNVIKKYGRNNAISYFNQTLMRSDPKLASSIQISLYKDLVRSGPRTAGIVIRYFANINDQLNDNVNSGASLTQNISVKTPSLLMMQTKHNVFD